MCIYCNSQILLKALPAQIVGAKRTRIGCPLENLPILCSKYLKLVYLSHQVTKHQKFNLFQGCYFKEVICVKKTKGKKKVMAELPV